MGAILAARDVSAQRRRAAVLDGAHHLELEQAHVTAVGMTPRGPVVAEDVGDLQSWTGHMGPLGWRLVLLRHWWREPVQRAHDLTDDVGGHLSVTSRGVELGMPEGELARAVIPVQVDIGFGDHVYPPPERRMFPCLLPNLPAANILMYPPETVIAEKFEAMIRFETANGRIKDFYDIWVTLRTFGFELPELVQAVGGTLRCRETAIPTEMPVGLTEAFAKIAVDRGLWTGFLRRNPPTIQPPPFPELQVELQRFLGRVIAGLAVPEGAKGRWDPDGGAWS